MNPEVGQSCLHFGSDHCFIYLTEIAVTDIALLSYPVGQLLRKRYFSVTSLRLRKVLYNPFLLYVLYLRLGNREDIILR